MKTVPKITFAAGIIFVTSITVFGFAALPISSICINAIDQALMHSLSPISPYILIQESIGFKVMLGFSAFIVAGNILLGLLFGFAKKDFASIAFSILCAGFAMSGLATCGFLLDTLNKITTQPNLYDTFSIITKCDNTTLQNIIAVEEFLIAGTVVFSALLVGCIIFTSYNIIK